MLSIRYGGFASCQNTRADESVKPAVPGAGAVILFTILSGMGFTGDQALIAYSLILAINRPIEMLVTSLNVAGDSVTTIAVAKSEGKLDEDVYNK